MRLILTALRHIKIFNPKTPFLFLLKADWCRPDGTQMRIYAFHTDRPNFLTGFLRVYALKHKKLYEIFAAKAGKEGVIKRMVC